MLPNWRTDSVSDFVFPRLQPLRNIFRLALSPSAAIVFTVADPLIAKASPRKLDDESFTAEPGDTPG